MPKNVFVALKQANEKLKEALAKKEPAREREMRRELAEAFEHVLNSCLDELEESHV